MENSKVQANTTLSPQDYSKVKRLAQAELLSVSAFIRRSILKDLDE